MKGALLLLLLLQLFAFSFSFHSRSAQSVVGSSKTSDTRSKALLITRGKSSSLFSSDPCGPHLPLHLDSERRPPTKTCKRCKSQFTPGDKSSTCRSHPGIYSGRLNRVNDVDTSDKEFFWSCCGEYDLHAPGCLNLDSHCSYDDDDSAHSYSVFTGKRVSYINR